MAKTAAQMAQSYQTSMASGATKQKYIDGINAVTENPCAAAITPEATAKYLANVERSVTNGKRARKLGAVSLQTWRDGAVNKGASRITSGAAAAQQKVAAHFQKWAPIYAQASAAAKAVADDGSREAMHRKIDAALDVMQNAAGTM